MSVLTLPDRLPPHSIEAEQSTLGSALISRSAIGEMLALLDRSDFYLEQHRKVFDVVEYLALRDQPVDLLSVPEELKRRGQLEQVGGVAYIGTLENSVPTAAHVTHYAQIVAEKSTLRKLMHAAGDLLARCYREEDAAQDIRTWAEGAIYEARAGKAVTDGLVQIRCQAAEVAMEITGLASGEFKARITSTGYGDLDQITGGLHGGDLVIVAGRPGMGKSCLAGQIAYNVSDQQRPAAIFSLEMGTGQILRRFAAMLAGVSLTRIRTGHISDDEGLDITRQLGRLGDLPLYMDETPGIGVPEIRSRCLRLRSRGDLGLVVVDYLQLMGGVGKSENRNLELGSITKALKNLARELDTPIMLLSQLSRQVERREDKRPLLSDLRDSGAIEADADVVLFPYRPLYYQRKEMGAGHETSDAPEPVELIVAKQRNGATGTVGMLFEGAYQRFWGLDRKHGDEDAPPERYERRFT